MADRKITDLTALAAGSQATGDLLTIVDVSEAAATDKNKKITVESLFKGIPGNVGIGATSPAAPLEVVGTTNGDQLRITQSGQHYRIGREGSGGLLEFYGAQSGYNGFIFGGANGERLRIDSSGRLLLGTTTEGYATYADNLTIADSGHCGLTIRSGTSSQGNIYFSDGTSGGSDEYMGIIQYLHNDNAMAFGVNNGTERMRISSTGQVLIGTTTAGSGDSDDLTIANSGNTGITIRSGSSNAAAIYFADGTSGSQNYQGIVQYVHSTDELQFYTNYAGNSNARMIIDSSGNVGIGTTSPSTLIHGEASTAELRLKSTGASNSALVSFIPGTQTNPFYVYVNPTRNLVFQDNSTERMRIDSSGRVLVGTTSNTNSANLDIQLDTVPATDTYAKLQLRSGNYGYILNGGLKQGEGGRLQFDLNNNNSVSTKMVLDTGGRLLVGTTSALLSTDVISGAKDGTVNVSIATTDTTFANNNNVLFRAQNQQGTRRAEIGVIRKNNNNPSAFLRLDEEDGGAAFVWADNSKILRISGSSGHIGTTSGTVVGTQTSDLRVKNVGANVGYGLAEVKQLQPKQYALKDDPDVNKLGFIAQEVESVIPEAVFDTNEELDGHQEGDRTKLGMEYVQLIPVLVNAIKELSAEVDTLKTKVAALEAA